MSEQFDFNKAVEALKNGQNLTGKDGLLTPLIKQLTEAALQAELEEYLENENQPNRRNGSSKKTVKTTTGSFELNTSRDRAGTTSRSWSRNIKRFSMMRLKTKCFLCLPWVTATGILLPTLLIFMAWIFLMPRSVR